MSDQTPAVHTYDAAAIVQLACCDGQTAVERMAYRWYLEPADEAAGRPAVLLAPRFAAVPALPLEVPDPSRAWDVYVTLWIPYGWFSHVRVRCAADLPPVLVAHPTFSGRPGYEDKVKSSGASQLHRSFVLTVPAGTKQIFLDKTQPMETALVSVRFEACDAPDKRSVQVGDSERPMVVGITDHGCLMGETLQAYEIEPLHSFYRQMKAMGFTHLFQQIYGGSATWSEVARPYKTDGLSFGHHKYANWTEPSKRRQFIGQMHDQEFQQDIDDIHAAGMKMFASFRINNEWLADWAKPHMTSTDGKFPDSASRFSVDHPEWWLTYKGGGRAGSGMDFGFPQVREHRRDLIAEWCDKFHDFDGICIDVHRHPGVVSYPEHLVRAFKEKTGIDVRTVEPIDQNTMLPEWLTFRAESFTEFMRMVRQVLRDRYGDAMPLAARVGNTFDQALLEGTDLRVWIQEKLVDLLVLQHRDPANPMEADTRPIIQAAEAQGIAVISLFGGWHGVDFPETDLSPVRGLLDQWSRWGAKGFGFYEAERIGRDGRWLREMPEVVNQWKTHT